MPAAKPRQNSATAAAEAGTPAPLEEPSRRATQTLPPARLADELAVPAASPVHQLHAELLQLTTPAEPAAEPLYPGWFRLAFPLASSLLLWAAILWGALRLA